MAQIVIILEPKYAKMKTANKDTSSNKSQPADSQKILAEKKKGSGMTAASMPKIPSPKEKVKDMDVTRRSNAESNVL